MTYFNSISVCMKKAATTAMAVWLGVASAGAQGAPLFRNFGTLTFPPATPVDAARVENHGTITVSGTTLWDTQNTLNFINTGGMSSSSGFRFDYLHDEFLPWFNTRRDPLQGFTNSGTIHTTGELLISATNIHNFAGLLSTGRGGHVLLSAPNGHIELFNSRVRSADGGDQFNSTEGFELVNNNGVPTDFVNPENVVNQYWGGTNGAGFLSLPTMSLGGISGSSSYAITNRGGIRSSDFLSIFPAVDTNFPTIPGYSMFLRTNLFPEDLGANPRVWRQMIQAVFVQTNLPNSPEIGVRFGNGLFVDGYIANEVTVGFRLQDFDPISGQIMDRYLTLTDRLPTEVDNRNNPTAFTGPQSFPRDFVREDTFRPSSYLVQRTDGFLGFNLFPEVPVAFDPDLFYNPGIRFGTNQIPANLGAEFATNRVRHAFAAYQFTVTPRDVPPGASTGVDVLTGDVLNDQYNDATNSPGRVDIEAATLDLGNATIRAENTINITASNITDMVGTRFDAQHVNINIPSTNGSFVLSNTFPGRVARFNGQVSVWSGLYQVNIFATNTVFGGITNIPGFPPLTGANRIETTYHVMVVDLDNFVLNTTGFGGLGGFFFSTTSQLSTNQPVDLPRLKVMSQNVELHDTNRITRELFLGGECLIIGTNGQFSLSDGLQTFGVNNAPRLICVTNFGGISIPQQANFGFDRFDASFNPLPYSNIVNHGTLSAGNLLFRSDYFGNTSNLVATGGSVFIEAATNRLAGGLLYGTDRVVMSGGELVTSNATIFAFNGMDLSISNRLSDQGITNNWFTSGGLNVNVKPIKGDLLATRLEATAPTNLNRTIIWAAEDRGDDPSGYNNNLALRELVLNGEPGSVFRFRGAGAANALYLNTITLTNNATNYASAITVDPNIKVYFANANVPPDKLTNAFPGRLFWVTTNTAAGPMVTLPASLSTQISISSSQLQTLFAGNPDVDNDGLPNEIDTTPLSGFTLNDVRVINLPPQTAVVTWQGVAGWTYFLEYRDSLDASFWTVLKTTIPASTGNVTELDTLPPKGQRFYRVRYVRPQ